tara:strand:- start:235 stop:573 length:339 start_codon:yes stop_codon:yes gene_type:complete
MNSLFTIAPYLTNGQWVFDDSTKGLKAEPLILGADTLCDLLFNKYGEFNIVFSSNKIPKYDLCLERESKSGEIAGGTQYIEAKTGQEAWLCPALFKYFDEAPFSLYVKASSR